MVNSAHRASAPDPMPARATSALNGRSIEPHVVKGPMGTAGPADGRATSWTNRTLWATLFEWFSAPAASAQTNESPKAVDTMQTPVVIELSRTSARPDADLASAGMRGPQAWRSVRASRPGRTNRTPGRPARPGVYTGGRS
jgi:hypothetical protein